MSYRLSGYSGHPGPLVGIHQPDIRPIGRRLYRNNTVYTVRVRITNPTQISRKVESVSRTQRTALSAGRRDEYVDQLAMRGEELKRDMEAALTSARGETATDTQYPIEVPAGFEYDGASVPRAAWTISGLTPDGLLRAAALLHDYLYRNHGHVGNGLFLTRSEADRLFLSLMLAAGVRPWRARLAYRAVKWLARRW